MKGLFPWFRESLFGQAKEKKPRCRMASKCAAGLAAFADPRCLGGLCTGCCNQFCRCGRPNSNDDPELAELRRMLK